MRLKEIKPRMAIHCKNDKEKKALLEEAERLGYVWYDTKQKPTQKLNCEGNTIHFYDKGKVSWIDGYKHITHSYQTGEGVTEFSDLILPELTAEEVLKILKEIRNCLGRSCDDCPFNSIGTRMCYGENAINVTRPDELLSACQKWKADHEKKEPEIETVDICRIIEIQPDGRKRCVHEEDIECEFPFGGDERQKTEEILKRYCMEHEGEYMAVHEIISRVKK